MTVDAQPKSLIYAGLKAGVTAQQFGTAITSGEAATLFTGFRPGPATYLILAERFTPSAGVLLAEIQQMSDATFRIDDGDASEPMASQESCTWPRPSN